MSRAYEVSRDKTPREVLEATFYLARVTAESVANLDDPRLAQLLRAIDTLRPVLVREVAVRKSSEELQEDLKAIAGFNLPRPAEMFGP